MIPIYTVYVLYLFIHLFIHNIVLENEEYECVIMSYEI